MNILAPNDSYVLICLERLGVRRNNPCTLLHLLDTTQKEFNMSREEAIKSIQYLGMIDYLDGNERFISFTSSFDDLMYKNKGKTMDREYSLQERKAARFKLLEAMYKGSGGSESAILNIHELGQELGFSNELNRLTYEYLQGESLIEFRAIGGLASLTHYGIREYERAIEYPEQETEYFPAASIVNNILHIGKIENSQVQVGTANSSQIIQKNAEYDSIVKWILEVEKALASEKDQMIVGQIKDEIESIKSLLSSERPSKKYIKMAMDVIKDLMLGIASNVAFQQLAAVIPAIIP